MLKNKFSILSLAILVTLSMSGCASKSNDTAGTEPTESYLVATSFYPLYDFATQVVGDDSLVFNVTPAGSEPHDFEPTAKDIAEIYKAKLFVYNGASMDPWAEEIAPDLEANGVKVLEMSEFVDLLEAVEHDHDDHSDEEHKDEKHEDEHDHDDHKGEEHKDEKHEDDHAHDHGDFDPHFWLDPVIAQAMVAEITKSLIEVDSANSSLYQTNSNNFIAELKNLDAEYTTGLKACEIRKAVTSHAAFNYLADRYNFESVSIAGFSPEEEPTSARLAELSELIQAEKIQYVFFETLVSPKLAETLAAEAGVKTLVFNPIEGLTAEQEEGEDYLSISRQNLENLKTALSCK